MKDIKDFLIEYCNRHFISGREYLNHYFLINSFKPYVDEVKIGTIGNIIFEKSGKGKKKIMIAAHMDEISMMVKYIDDNGFISIIPSGGIYPISVVGQEVIIYGKEKVVGVIAVKHRYLIDDEEANKAVKFEDLFVDTGYGKDELEEKIRIGNAIGINRDGEELCNNCVSGRGMDDKAGVAVMYEAAKQLANIDCETDVYFVATAQEEVGILGATVAQDETNCDMVIAIDVGFGNQPYMKENDTLKLGKGSAIALGAMCNPIITKRMEEVAKRENIDYQYDIFPTYTGCDADIINISRAGVPDIVISVPDRYMHSCVEVIDTRDIKSIAKLIVEFIKDIDTEELEDILCY